MDFIQSYLFAVRGRAWTAALLFGTFGLSAEGIEFSQPRVGLSVGAPSPLGIEAQFFQPRSRLTPVIQIGTLGLQFGKQNSFNIFLAQAGFRTPFFNSDTFFFQLSTGYRNVILAANTTALKMEDETIATEAEVNLKNWLLTPKIGATFHLSEKLAIEFDLGLQIPVIATGNMRLVNSENGDTSDTNPLLEVESGRFISRIAKYWVPELTLFRLMWKF